MTQIIHLQLEEGCNLDHTLNTFALQIVDKNKNVYVSVSQNALFLNVLAKSVQWLGIYNVATSVFAIYTHILCYLWRSFGWGDKREEIGEGLLILK